MKRLPTLADRLLADHPVKPTYVASSWREQTLDWLRLAKRFVLDESAAIYLGQMIERYPRIIADAQDFAIQPYENLWIEFPSRPFFRAVTGSDDHDERTDTRQGFVFNQGRVRVAAEGAGGDVGVLPLEYRLHTPMDEAALEAVCERLSLSRLGVDFWLWGYTARHFVGGRTRVAATEDDETWDKASLRSLRSNHSARLAPMMGDVGPTLAKISDACAGDLRNAVALLLFLNRTANITLAEGVPMGEGFIRNKLRPLLSHRVIRLKLDPLPRLARLCAGLGIKRRLHDVRGHFCHDRVAREEGCPHGQEHEGDFGDWWEEYEPLRWSCTGCGGKRWWRHEHKRGHGELGATVQEYEVTK